MSTSQTHLIITPRDRILAAVNHEPVDKVPTDMWATVEVQEKLLEHFEIKAGLGESPSGIGLNGGILSRGVAGLLALWDRLGIDGILEVRPPYIGPELRKSIDIYYNEWGFGYRQKGYFEGTYDEQTYYPLQHIESVEELEDVPWPDPDWYDYSALPGLIDQCGGRAICCGYSAVLTYHNYLRGLEKSLMDPLIDPELCRIIIKNLSDFFHEYHMRCFEAGEGRIDFTQVTDDWGGQTGLLSSPDIFRTFYKQPMERAISLARKYNILVFHHDDGDMRMLLPEILGLGVDILNPVQWRCGGWDLRKLKDEYGQKFCFHSAVDNQETLPFGTPGEIKAEVKYLIETLGGDGTGFILGPCHNIQPNTPVENIMAMYEAAAEFGTLGTKK